MSEALTIPLPALHDLCVARLRECVDEKTGLFGRQIRNALPAPTLGTEDITSTAICAIGLARAGIPMRAVTEPDALLRRAATRLRATGYAGGIGLLLWANAALRRMRTEDLLAEAGHGPGSLEAIAPTLTTMEVAWLVSGLLHAASPALHRAGDIARTELRSRLDPNTLTFAHASRAAPLRHSLRRRVANFADQIYPVQALAFSALARGDAGDRQLAERCAARVVSQQGPLGQWWWHHDSATGRVIERYPVYSVHQHSMAPMALRCLAVAGGPDHAAATARSRLWLQANELQCDMLCASTGVIWRSIERDETRLARARRQARTALAMPCSETAPPRLVLNREIRPYEWGWLLYASAIESTPAAEGHIV